MEGPNAVVTIYEVYTGKSTSEDNALPSIYISIPKTPWLVIYIFFWS